MWFLDEDPDKETPQMKDQFTRQGVRDLNFIGGKPKLSQAKCTHPTDAVAQDERSGNLICKRCRRDLGPPPADPRAD